MATRTYDQTTGLSTNFAEALRNSLDRVRAGYERHANYLEAVRQLSDLSDRDLADIGIRRGDIHQVALGSSERTIK